MAHGDYTGNSKALLAQKHAQEQALAAKNTSLVSQVVAESREEVIDLFSDADYENLERQKQVTEQDGEVQVVDSDNPEFKARLFRASETLDDITIGKDRSFNIKQGQTYRAPHWVVRHLDEKQLVWH